MELSRKQLTKIIDEQAQKLTRDSFVSYDGNDNNEQLLICRYQNEIKIFFETIKRSFSRNINEMSFKERICKEEIITAILANAESYYFDYQIWHALNSIYDVLDEIFQKCSETFFKQYPNFIFDKNILLDIATSYLMRISTFYVQAHFLPMNTYSCFEEFYRFENFEEFKKFAKNPKDRILNSISRSIGFHYSVPVRVILNTYSAFNGEQRLHETYLFDVKYDVSKGKMIVIKS